MSLKRYLPILDWGPKYNKRDFRRDLIAGLTVAVILVPQGMAYALLAGLPPIYGLYAGTIPLFLYAFFGTSRQLSVGPVALVSLITLSGISALGFDPYTPEFITMAISVALLAGIIQILLAVFRLGFLVNFLSHPVISGFTTAAAIIIAISQLGNLLGLQMGRSNLLHVVIGNVLEKINEIHWQTALIGFGGIALLVIIKKIRRSLPNALMVLTLGTLIVYFAKLDMIGVGVVGDVPGGLPGLLVPQFDIATITLLLPLALTICLISFIESLAIAKTIESQRKDHVVVADQELLALGVSKIGGAFFQCFPTTGSFSRSAINNEANASTGVASIISALLVGMALLFLTPLFYFIPKAVLAAVIIMSVFGLLDFKEAAYLWKRHKKDFWAWMTTFVITLFVGIQAGVISGVVLSLAIILWHSSVPNVVVMGHLKGTGVYRNVNRFKGLEEEKEILIIRFDSQLYFANVAHFKTSLEAALTKKGEELRVLILDAGGIHDMDSTGVHAMKELVTELANKEIEFYISGALGPVRDVLARENMFEEIGYKNQFISIRDAVNYFHTREDRKGKSLGWTEKALQTNEEDTKKKK